MKTLKPMVYLEWDDSYANYGWHKPEDLKDNIELRKIVSIGFIVKEDDDSLTISDSIGGTGSCSDPMTIPKRAILKREEFEFLKV